MYRRRRVKLARRCCACAASAAALTSTPRTRLQVRHDGLAQPRTLALGLASQVRPHVERRFSMPWGRPAARMAELIRAVRAIWAAWDTGEPLRLQGEFYRHTLITPTFSPGPNPYCHSPILLAGVGPDDEGRWRGRRRAARAPFTTPAYLTDVSLPSFHNGLSKSGRNRGEVEVHIPVLVATGPTDAAIAAAAEGIRRLVALYGSTPAYRPVLERHGWGHLGVELHRLSRGTDPDRWGRLASVVDDAVLHEFAVVGTPDDVAPQVVPRYQGLADRVSLYAPAGTGEECLNEVALRLRATCDEPGASSS